MIKTMCRPGDILLDTKRVSQSLPLARHCVEKGRKDQEVVCFACGSVGLQMSLRDQKLKKGNL